MVNHGAEELLELDELELQSFFSLKLNAGSVCGYSAFGRAIDC
jgi:hypothetical protein